MSGEKKGEDQLPGHVAKDFAAVAPKRSSGYRPGALGCIRRRQGLPNGPP
jgi:hypothetical protein